jgi:hypothetical protein
LGCAYFRNLTIAALESINNEKNTMSNWFYYNEKGEKIAVTGGQLKGLAKAGQIRLVRKHPHKIAHSIKKCYF